MIETENITEADFRKLSQAVYDHCGIELKDGKQELVRARVAKRLRATGRTNASAYLNEVLADKQGSEFTSLIDALSTNLTSFFRENQHFLFLSKTFLPELLERKQRSGQKTLRAWSAGCSTGEEPYTIAMTLLETIPNFQNWDVKILATDLSTNVLRQAAAGIYDADRAATIPQPLRNKYFTPTKKDGENAFAAGNQLRNMIKFNYLNLMEPWPFRGPFDFIFCRNVMIYFDKPTQAKLINRYYECLSPRGVLFTGHSESLAGIQHKLDFVQPTIYRRS